MGDVKLIAFRGSKTSGIQINEYTDVGHSNRNSIQEETIFEEGHDGMKSLFFLNCLPKINLHLLENVIQQTCT